MNDKINQDAVKAYDQTVVVSKNGFENMNILSARNPTSNRSSHIEII